MGVGILLIAHQGVGEAFLEVLNQTFDQNLPLSIELLSVNHHHSAEALSHLAKKHVALLDQGMGVLVITDLFGATPANIAQAVARSYHAVEVISGLNLPMLIRLCNYPNLSLTKLLEKALSGGKEGVCYRRKLPSMNMQELAYHC